MSPRRYYYVGPHDVREAAAASPPGTHVLSFADLLEWLDLHDGDAERDGRIVATFVIDTTGSLRLAPRRSEHVACAAGGPVLSAGEMTFSGEGAVVDISNQSTGFCPEVASWPSVARALDRLPATHPGKFTVPVLFRLCPQCNERNIVKDGWFVCELCGSDLPPDWNFAAAS